MSDLTLSAANGDTLLLGDVTVAYPNLQGPTGPTGSTGSTGPTGTTILESHLHWPPVSYVHALAGNWAVAAAGSNVEPFAQDYYNTSVAQHDAITWQFLRAFAAGTYTLQVTYSVNASGGIVTFATSPDGASFAPVAGVSLDTYNAVQSYGKVSTFTGIAIPASTLYLKAAVDTKNAASIGYYMVLEALDLARTA